MIFAYLSIFVNSPWIRICAGITPGYLRLVFVHPLVQRSFLVFVRAQEQVGCNSANRQCDGMTDDQFHNIPFLFLVFTMQEKGVRSARKMLLLSFGAHMGLMILARVVDMPGRDKLSATRAGTAVAVTASRARVRGNIHRSIGRSIRARRTQQSSTASDTASIRHSRDEPRAMRSRQHLQVFWCLGTGRRRGNNHGGRRRKNSTGSYPIEFNVVNATRLMHGRATNASQKDEAEVFHTYDFCLVVV